MEIRAIFILTALALVVAFYLLPTVVASHRGTERQNGITLVNVLFGWTVLGWIAALLWACTETVEKEAGEDESGEEKL